MGAGEVKEVTFVDDPLGEDLIPIREYQIPLNGVWAKSVYLTSNPNDPTDPLIARYGSEFAHTHMYCTILNNTGYTNKKGEAIKHELQLFAIKSPTFQDLSNEAREKEGNLKGWQVVLTRVGQKAPISCKKRKQRINLQSSAIFQVVRYQGKLLSEWFDEAEKDNAVMQALGKVFKLSRSGDGKLARVVPVFNYESLLALKTPEEIAKALGLTEPLTGPFGSTSKAAPERFRASADSDPFASDAETGEVTESSAFGDEIQANEGNFNEADIPF